MPIVVHKAQARWRVGKLLPLLRVTLKYPNGDAVDLTGYASIKLFAYDVGESSLTPKVNGGAMAALGAPTAGIATYTWVSGDLDTAGSFIGFVQGEPSLGTFWWSEEFYYDVLALGQPARRY